MQFRTRYKLTEKGRETAEFGEYDLSVTSQEAELRGPAAVVFSAAKGRGRGR